MEALNHNVKKSNLRGEKKKDITYLVITRYYVVIMTSLYC